MRYIWEKEVKNIDWNLIEFVDWTSKSFNDIQLEYIITETPMDATAFRSICVMNAVEDILPILKDHCITKWQMEAVFLTIKGSFDEKFCRALGEYFGTNKDEVLHHRDFIENIDFNKLDSVLEG